MKHRDQWRPVLEAEMKRWSAMSCTELASQVAAVQTYEVEFESKMYHVEVQILENTDSYVYVGIAVDDGHFWRAMRPLSSSFIRRKMAQSDAWRNIAVSLIGHAKRRTKSAHL
jgi:hypothetical protein